MNKRTILQGKFCGRSVMGKQIPQAKILSMLNLALAVHFESFKL